MRRSPWWLGLLGLWGACDGGSSPAEVAAVPAQPIRISVRAAEHRPQTREFERRVLGLIFERVGQRTGLEIELAEAPLTIAEQLSRVEAGTADAFLMSPFTYLLARERLGVEPLLAVQKRGRSSLYVEELVAERSSGIAEVQDLRGKRLVLDVEAHSNPVRFWLGYDLLARAGLVAKGRTDASDYALEVVLDPTLDRNRSLIEVLEGRADAALTFHAQVDESKHVRDGRYFHLDRYPDVMERLQVVALSAAVPYPVLAFRRGFDAHQARRFADEVLAYLATPEGARLAFKELRPGSEGLGPIRDADFDELRRMVADHGIDVEAMLEHDDDTY